MEHNPAARTIATALGRRTWLRAALALAATGATTTALAACSTGPGRPAGTGGTSHQTGSGMSSGTSTGTSQAFELVSSRQGRVAGDPHSLGPAAGAVQDFTADLARAAGSAHPANQVLSPVSMHVALGMAALGARGATAAEMLRTLHATDAGQLAVGLNALTAHLTSLTRTARRADGSTAETRLALADAVWGQRGTPWAPPFLDALAEQFGAGLRVVDYVDPAGRERARAAINAWTEEQTAHTIHDLIGPDVLDRDTRMVLVNAAYLKAAWQEPFEPAATTDGAFTRADGTAVRAPFMQRTAAFGYARGDGWQAARLPYAGDLAMTLVLPDAGRFAWLVGSLTGARLRTLLADLPPTGLTLALPRWKARSALSLRDVLGGLGLRAAFTDGADFGGMTTDGTPLKISDVLHQGWIAVDEQGTEASAATAVVMQLAAGVASSVELRLDRPFLWVIHDTRTRTPLFVGRVGDPTATA